MTAPSVNLGVHQRAKGLSDTVTIASTRMLRRTADTFFTKRCGHRAIMLRAVAAAPGRVGATLNRATCLRMCEDRGWFRPLMDEAENERMHLMTF